MQPHRRRGPIQSMRSMRQDWRAKRHVHPHWARAPVAIVTGDFITFSAPLISSPEQLLP